MGITMGMYAVGDANIDRMFADPRVFYRIVAPDDPEAWNQHQNKVPFWKKLFGKKPAAPQPPPQVTLAPGEGEIVDLDKSWHGLQYLYTGEADGGVSPLDFITSGGRELPDTDNGLGCARVFNAAETAAIHRALQPLHEAELRARFNPGEMMKCDIYPTIWDRDPAEDDTLGYLIDNHNALMEFLGKTAAQRLGMIVEVS